MNCKKCNFLLSPQARFCPNCGSPVTNDTPTGNQVIPPVAPSAPKAPDSPSTQQNINPMMPNQSMAPNMFAGGMPGSQQTQQTVSPGNQLAGTPFPSAQNQQTAMGTFAPETNSGRAKKEKKKNKFLIPAIAGGVAVVLAGTGLIAHAQISNFCRKTFSSPEKYYRYVEENNRDKAAKKAGSRYAKYLAASNTSGANEAQIKLELGEAAKSLLSVAGLSSLSSVSIDGVVQQNDGVYDLTSSVQLNDKDFLSCNLYANMDEKSVYLQIPELSSSYLDLASQIDMEQEDLDTLSKLYNYDQWLPTQEAVEDFYVRYYDIFLQNMEDVKKSSETITADTVSANYTALNVTCDAKNTKDLLSEICAELEDDPMITSTLEALSEEAATEYKEECQSLQEDISDMTLTDEDFQGEMTIYVDSKGTIVGRTIQVTADGETMEVQCLTPRKGNTMGALFQVRANDTNYMTLSGSGTVKKSKLSGTFHVTSEMDELSEISDTLDADKDLVQIDAKNFSVSNDGSLNGNLTLSCPAMAVISNYAVELSFAQNKEKSATSISLYSGSGESRSEWGTLQIATAKKADAISAKPTDEDEICDLNDYDAADAYAAEAQENLETLLQTLSEETGLDEDLLNNYISMDDDYDDYSDQDADPYSYDYYEDDWEDDYYSY